VKREKRRRKNFTTELHGGKRSFTEEEKRKRSHGGTESTELTGRRNKNKDIPRRYILNFLLFTP